MFTFAALVVAATATLATAQSQVTIDLSTKYQTIDGFGFSEAFGFGEGIVNAPEEQQNQALTYLFNTTSGAGLTILRNEISADKGTTIAPNSPGSPEKALAFTWDGKDAGQVFWSKKARELGVEYIYADAWSAPAYMKTNNNVQNGGHLCGMTDETCSSGDWRETYADYLVQYIKYYEQEGITIDFLGFLNEPEYSPAYDSMLADGTQAASFIPILHNKIKSAGISTAITCCDAEGWEDQVTFTQQLEAAGATQYLGRITSHWYTSQGKSPINTDLRVWETEYADLDDAFSTTWYKSGALNEGMTWAGLLYQGLVDANLSAFLYWIGAQAGGNAACLVNLSGSGSSTSVTPSGTLWAFAMFSRYIRPNAVRVAASGGRTGTKAAAFQNTDGSVVVVMLNQGSDSQEISLGGTPISSVAAYVMDNSVSFPSVLSTTMNGGKVAATIPGHSVVSFVLKTNSAAKESNSVSIAPIPSSTVVSAASTASTASSIAVVTPSSTLIASATPSSSSIPHTKSHHHHSAHHHSGHHHSGHHHSGHHHSTASPESTGTCQ